MVCGGSGKSTLRRGDSLVAVFSGNFYMPIPSVTIPHGKGSYVAEGIDAIIHPRDQIGIPNGKCVEVSVVDTEPHGIVVFRVEYHGTYIFGRGKFNYPCPEHSTYLRFIFFPWRWHGAVRRLVNRACPDLSSRTCFNASIIPNMPIHILLNSDSTLRTSERTSSSSAPIWTSSCQGLGYYPGAAVSWGPPSPSAIGRSLGGVACSDSTCSMRLLEVSAISCENRSGWEVGTKYSSPFPGFDRFRDQLAKGQDVIERR